MNQEHLAIASVPVQEWSVTLDAKEALQTGTIFPELNKPFFVTEKPESALNKGKKPEELGKREQLMLDIQQISFVLDDIRLFMDTHPEEKNGLELLKTALKTRKGLLAEFAVQFYPLTMDCMTDVYAKEPTSECYCWAEGPMPWEGACV